MNRHYEIDDPEEAVDLLNVLYLDLDQWQYTHGRRDYVDMFGITITAGDLHYRRGEETAASPALRLSDESMKNVLSALMGRNPRLVKWLRLQRDEMQDELMNRAHQASRSK